MPVARAHHFVPQFLLAGFTPLGSKEDFLWAFDRKTGKQWHTKPANVAHRKDFYRVDVPGVPPDVVESGLSKMESHSSNVIREIIRTKTIPRGDDYVTFMNFTALMSVRVPSGRDMINQGVDFISKQHLKAALSTPESWAAELHEARTAGVDIDEDAASYETIKECLGKGRYTFAVDQNWRIKTMLELMGKLAPCFAPREWCLAISSSGGFICSDRPVTVRFTRRKAAMDSPGLMREDTEISFPLSRHVLLIGSWEPFKSHTIALTRKNIALYNGITARHCERFLFSSTKDFCWLDKDGKVRYDFDPLARPVQREE